MSDCFEVPCVQYVGQGWRDRLALQRCWEWLISLGRILWVFFFTVCSSQAAVSHGQWPQVLDHLPEGEIYPGSCWKGNSCGLVSVRALKNEIFLLHIGELFKDGLFMLLLCSLSICISERWYLGAFQQLPGTTEDVDQAPFTAWAAVPNFLWKTVPFQSLALCIAKPEMLMG